MRPFPISSMRSESRFRNALMEAPVRPGRRFARPAMCGRRTGAGDCRFPADSVEPPRINVAAAPRSGHPLGVTLTAIVSPVVRPHLSVAP
jgi:hypothetical protein